MNTRSLTNYLKFVPLVALFAFGVTLISLPKNTEATPLGAPTLSLTVVPLNGSTVVTAMYTDDTPAGSGSAVLASTAAIGTFTTGAVTPLNGETVTTGANVTVTEDGDTLATSKTITATFQCTVAGLTTFTISHGGTTSPQSVTLLCGDYYGQYPGYQYPGAYYPYTQYPYGTQQQFPTAYTTATALTVAASPASVTCASPSTISVTVKDSNGNIAPNGTSVTVSASTGTISPNVVSTTGGIATTTYTAPNNSNGTATDISVTPNANSATRGTNFK